MIRNIVFDMGMVLLDHDPLLPCIRHAGHERAQALCDGIFWHPECSGLLDSGEMVNIGNFNDADTAEIIRIILDIFAEDKKAVFDVNLEVFGIRNFLEMLRYVSADSDSVYRIMINELKQQLKSGELDVSFS